MPEQSEIMRVLTASPVDLMRSLFKPGEGVAVPSDPLHTDVPTLRGAEVAAVYYKQRVAGDFYEFLRVGPSRVLFGLLDLAGRRENTRKTLIAAQNCFRTSGLQLFAGDVLNEAEAVIELSHRINRTILEVNEGVRTCPAFIGCYNEDLGTVCYTNAGYTPGLLRDPSGIATLEATGIPLGLFSHATYSASTCGMIPGAMLLMVSRGIVEAEFGGEEFGLERVRECLQQPLVETAQELCLRVLDTTQTFLRLPPLHNDVTTLALLRNL
jgi:serine phosphatase RsbU (regulator of sigma subunit)